MLSLIRTIYFTVTGLTILLTLWALSRCIDTVTSPLEQLCDQIRIWEREDRSQKFQYPYQDEIGVLAGADDISRMTTALATLFRISLSQGREIITVEQELRHVESYLMIQKMRYSDRITYSVDVDPEILKLTTIKLILQPLVENAIYHGIKESTHSGSVHVTGCRMGDVLQLQVTDNGLGIPEEKLALLNEDLARGRSVSREGYGIFNVNERIRLRYGPEYSHRIHAGLPAAEEYQVQCSQPVHRLYPHHYVSGRYGTDFLPAVQHLQR